MAIADTDSTLDSPFSMNELENSISNLKSTAPGIDGIHNDMLKNLPESYRAFLLSLLNDSYDKAYVLEKWKISLTVPILKPNKSP